MPKVFWWASRWLRNAFRTFSKLNVTRIKFPQRAFIRIRKFKYLKKWRTQSLHVTLSINWKKLQLQLHTGSWNQEKRLRDFWKYSLAPLRFNMGKCFSIKEFQIHQHIFAQKLFLLHSCTSVHSGTVLILILERDHQKKTLLTTTWVWSAPFLSIHFHMHFSNNEIVRLSYF